MTETSISVILYRGKGKTIWPTIYRPRSVFTLYPLQLTDVKVALLLQLLQLELEVGVLLLERQLTQLEDLVLLIVLGDGQPADINRQKANSLTIQTNYK